MVVPTQFAYRTLKGIGVVNAAPVYENLPGFTRPEGNLRCCTYSPCGRYFAWASPEQVAVVNASTGAVITSLPSHNVYELGFSPLGNFIITWERPSKDEDGNATKNLKVWRVVEDFANGEEQTSERSVVGKFVQKSQTGWNLQYTTDEALCARAVSNEVQFYESGNLQQVWDKLRIEGVTDFALSPGKAHSVAVFVPERKGQPAAVKVFNVPNFTSAVSQKTFFKGDKVQLKWNELGTSLVVLAQTEVDKTGKSYYGETNLYILSANGGFDSRIGLDKDGPIHDVTWSPNSKEFGVVYGYMPAKSTVFNVRAVAMHSFPLKPRNTILFSPNGRFVLVAGFGNLAGQIDIYDLEKDYDKIATIESSNPSVCEWSPDSQFILTATTSPRLRVDNGVRIWHVGGTLMYNEDLTELYHVVWRPQPAQQQAPGNALHPAPIPHSSAVAYLGTVKTPSKPAGAYRPPGARGQVTPLHFKREDEGGAAHVSNGGAPFAGGGVNGFGKPRRREVPGAEAALESSLPGTAPGGGISIAGVAEGEEGLSKAAVKNKKKREAKKAKEAAEKAANLSSGEPGGADAAKPLLAPTNRSPERREKGVHGRSRSRNEQDGRSGAHRREGSHAHRNESPWRASARPPSPRRTKAVEVAAETPAPAAPAPQPEPPTVVSPGGGTLHEKKVRGLLKKIRAIDDLKMRLASGEKLENTQMQKISSEDSVRKELDALGIVG